MNTDFSVSVALPYQPAAAVKTTSPASDMSLLAVVSANAAAPA